MLSVARYCIYRPAGLAIAPPAPVLAQSDHDASGVAVLPERVAKTTPAAPPVAVSVPHAARESPLSNTREMSVPLAGKRSRTMLSTVTARVPATER